MVTINSGCVVKEESDADVVRKAVGLAVEEVYIKEWALKKPIKAVLASFVWHRCS